MTFWDCVNRTEALKADYCKGLKALTGADRTRITADDPRKITGSVNLDSALRRLHPNDARWDYLIGYAGSKTQLYLVEIHPAASGANIQEITNKLTWLLNWLSNGGREFRAMKRNILWVSSGRARFSQNSPDLRRLATRGLQFVGAHLRIT